MTLLDGGRLLDRHQFARWANDAMGWDVDTGAPAIGLLGSALRVWVLLQDRPTSVAEAARVFNLEPTRIVEAVELQPHLCLAGPRDDVARLIIEPRGDTP